MYWCYFIVALLVSRVPLFDILGYESAAIFGVVSSVMVLCTVELPYKQENLLDWWMHESSRQLKALNIVPFVYMVNGIWVQNCDWWSGIQFWIVIPCASVLLVVAFVGIASGFRISKARGFVAVCLLLELLWFAWRLAWWPPINGYSITFGWFAGSIYDEALSMSNGLLVYRCHLMLGTVIVLLGLNCIQFKKIFGLCTLMVIQLLLFVNFQEPTVFRSAHWVQHQLGGVLETEHFIVYFDPVSIQEDMEYALKQDLEFRYWEMIQFFNEDPVQWKNRKIEVFMYPNVDEQQRLMGSRNTFVARPWTHQLHIRWRYGSSTLAHELAHIFTAPFGSPIFNLPMYSNGLPNIGLLEGVAVAADWSQDDFSTHEIAATLFQDKALPDLRSSFDPVGFWKSPSGKAYQGVGSFIRWLIESEGVDSIKYWYQGAEFNEVYGYSVGSAISRWENWLSGVIVDKNHKKQILMNYSSKSIFQKVCARRIAHQQNVIAEMLQLRRNEEADQAMDVLLNWRDSTYFQYLKSKKLFENKHLVDYDSLSIKAHGEIVETTSLRWKDLWVNWLVDNNRSTEALAFLTNIEEWPMSHSWFRQFYIKRLFIEKGHSLEYFSDSWSTIDRLSWVLTTSLDEDLDSYLMAVNLFALGQFETLAMIQQVETLHPIVQENFWKMQLEGALQRGDVDYATGHISNAQNLKKVQEYSDRIDFLTNYRP